MWNPGLAEKGVNVMQFLMNGKDFFKARHIYIYIYIWKADKDVMEIKFFYPMFACEGKRYSM